MNLKDFITKISGDYNSVISVIEKCSPEEITEYAAALLSVSVDELKSSKIIGSEYKRNIAEIIRNKKYIIKLFSLLNDDVSNHSLTCLLRYILVPYDKFMTSVISENISESDVYNQIKDIVLRKNELKNETPEISFSVKTISDFWVIPSLINSVNNRYRYSFNHYKSSDGWNTVITAAVPATAENSKTKKKIRKIVALHYGPGWTNTELTKDCGFIPYLLYKNHNCESVMVGVKKDNYTYLDTYVNGMKMEFLETGSEEEKQDYIKIHASEIDGLLLRGAYSSNFEIAEIYKRYNPAGKIYVGLDANSHWMDRIAWKDSEFIRFMENCDVIATSCTAMQNYLNKKWPWKIEYIPNGYIKYSDDYTLPDFKKKSDVILTVSRLGTLQKATNVLLEAFALIAETVPDWSLRLAGNIDSDFETYIEDYYIRHPELTDRVTFTGVISDKNKLTQEYRNAKIFALPSTFEGGTPNVVAEALIAGCAMAVTKFDAWEDAVACGKCGDAAEINDINGFADVLMRLCTDKNLEEKSRAAYNHAVHNFDMEKVVARLYEMMFGGAEK